MSLEALFCLLAIEMESNKSGPKLKALKKCWTRLTVECDNFESIQLNIVTINLLIRYAQPIPVSQSLSDLHRSVDLSNIVEWARWLLVSHCLWGISEIFESIVRRFVLSILNWFDGFFYWFLISQFSVWIAQLPRLPRGAPVSLMKFKFWLELCSQHTK